MPKISDQSIKDGFISSHNLVLQSIMQGKARRQKHKEAAHHIESTYSHEARGNEWRCSSSVVFIHSLGPHSMQ